MPPLLKILLIGTGGFTGAVLRYLASGLMHRLLTNGSIFPYGTFFVNITGCLAIGVLSGFADSRLLFSPGIRLFIFIGLLGGFTTFSTFGIESFYLIQEKQFLLFGLNIVGQVILGLLAVWLGYTIVK